MVRLNHYLTVPQVNRLRALAKKAGLPVAEVVRRALDAYLDKQKVRS